MRTCHTCHNDYINCFEVILGGHSYFFDCFECAIQALAPSCARCGCKIIGHSTVVDEQLYCCLHCANSHLSHPAALFVPPNVPLKL